MGGRLMLWGCSGDAPLDAVRAELLRRGEAPVFLDQRDNLDVRFELDTTRGAKGHLQLAAERIALDEIGAMFVRPFDGREILRGKENERDEHRDAHRDTELLAREVVALERRLFIWADIADFLVVNRPSAMASNLSKPFQSELIRTQGFAIPETLVTTSPRSARDFIARHKRVIAKSVSGQISVTNRVTPADLDRIEDIVHCPTQFQKQIAGLDWRVHVVGDDVFACEIHCDADDYRVIDEKSGALRIVVAELPEPIAARCRAVARLLDLPLAGIDLRRTSEDEWFCFEVNATPAFTYYERVAGQPLTAAVADLLLTGARRYSA